MIAPILTKICSYANGYLKVRVLCIRILFLFLISIYCNSLHAQVSVYYNFSQSIGGYTPGLSTTSPTPADVFALAWDDVTTVYNLPFDFTYNGTLYSSAGGKIGVDADGWITFGNGALTMTGSGGGGSWVSISDHTGVYLNGNANNNGFAGFNCDLNSQSFPNVSGVRTLGSNTITGVSSTANLFIGTRLSGTGIVNGSVVTSIVGTTITMSAPASQSATGSNISPSSSIYAFTRGTAPNRQFVVQWTQAARYSGSGTENINFQLILNEGNANPTTQTIQAVYGACSTTATENLEVQVGIRGAAATDFNARKSSSGWAATATATANTDLVRFNNSLAPSNGLTFTWAPCSAAPSSPGALSGTNPVCANSTAVYTLAAVPGATIYHWSYSGTGATFTTPTNTPSVSVSFAPGATNGNLSVQAANICGTNASASILSLTVNPAPLAYIAYPSASYCTSFSGTVPVMFSGTTGGTYSVNPAGLAIDLAGTINPSASNAGTYTVNYNFSNGVCPNVASTTVVINALPQVTATASPALICIGGSSQLQASINNGVGYTVSSIPFVNTAPSGTPTIIWNSYIDDGMSAAINLPFSFNYFGQNITRFYVSTNGYIELQTNSGTASFPQTFPDAGTPNNVIAFAWEDLVVDPSTNAGAYVRYFVNGSTPNRVVVIEYFNLRFLGGTGGQNVTGQIKLYESDNHIEVAAATVNDNNSFYTKTMGIENNTGLLALTPPGRNNATWNFTMPEAWSFNPTAGGYTYLWTPATFLNNTGISNPIASNVSSTTTYNVQVTSISLGCSANSFVSVTASSPLNGTYTVGSGGNYPTLTAAVNAYNNLCIGGAVTFTLIDANYSAAETFPIEISNNAYQNATNTLTIKPAPGVNVTITGAVDNTALIKISGKYIRINGSNNNSTSMNLTVSNTSTFSPVVVWLGSETNSLPVSNVSVKNCTLKNGVNTISAVVISNANALGSPGYFKNDTIQNNKIQKAYIGIFAVGTGEIGNGTGLYIASNDLASSGTNAIASTGIYVEGVDGASVTGNHVANFESVSDEMDAGIWIAYGSSNCLVDGNNIHDIKYSGSVGYAGQGIKVSTGMANANVVVSNNMIYAISGDGDNFATFGATYSPTGIFAYSPGQEGVYIYHNTIYLTGNTLQGGSRASVGIALGDDSKALIRNNIIHNKLGKVNGSGAQVGSICIAAQTDNSQFTALDNNDYYVNPTGPGNKLIGRIGTTNQTTLAGWRTATGKEVNGLNILPVFISATDLHMDAADLGNQANLSDKGSATSVSYDFDNASRNGFTPDIGADEWIKPNTGSWVGRVSTDWLDASNWEANSIPGATTDVIVTGGYNFMPTIVTTQEVRNLAFSKPNIFNVPLLTLNNGTLRVNGTLSRTTGTTASIDGSRGTLEMKGSTAQTIPDSIFINNNLSNLVIANTNSVTGVTLAGALDIYRSVTFSAAGLKLTTNGNLTFKSTATQTAWLGNVTGKTINGNATVERYIPNHAKAWQFLSVPTIGQTVNAAWQEAQAPMIPGVANRGTIITSNVAGAGFDLIGGSGPSMKTYNAGVWTGIANTNILIANQKGYMILVRGDRTVTVFNQPATYTVLRTTGKLYTTGADLPPTTNVPAAGFASVGNPYASAIDLTLLTRTGGVQDIFIVWDPKLTTAPSAYGLGAYQTFSRNGASYDVTPGGGSYPSGTCKTIESGQAFFVRAPLSSGTVSFTEAAKTSGSNLVTRPNNFTIQKQLRTNLYVLNSSSRILVDGNLLQYDPEFSNSIDLDDGLKIENTSENIGLESNGQTLAVERRKKLHAGDTVFFEMNQLRVQQYELEFIAKNLQQNGLTAFLEDKYLHASNVISLDDTTRVAFNVTQDPSSYAPNRFCIVFRKLIVTPVSFVSIDASRNAGGFVKLNWKVDNEINVRSYQIELSSDGRNFNGIQSALPIANNGSAASYNAVDTRPVQDHNFYRIRALSFNGQIQYSAVVRLTSEKDPAAVSIFPNPGKDKIVQLHLIAQPAGTYQLFISNKLGQVLHRETLLINGSNQVYIIVLASDFLTGTYAVTVSNESRNIFSGQLLVE